MSWKHFLLVILTIFTFSLVVAACGGDGDSTNDAGSGGQSDNSANDGKDGGANEDDSETVVHDSSKGPCEPNPCQDKHKTICTNDNGQANCSCDQDFKDYGQGKCLPKDPCTNDTKCKGDNRKCENDSGSAKCGGCLGGFHQDGSSCVKDEECQANTCSGHGQCDHSTGVPICSCDQEYDGHSCGKCATGYHNDGTGVCTDDVCRPNPCQETNRGVCSSDTGQAVCKCDSGFKDKGDGKCVEDKSDEKSVPATGGHLSFKNKIEMDIAAGSLGSATNITTDIVEEEDVDQSTIPGGKIFAGGASFGPHGTKFDKPIIVKIPLKIKGEPGQFVTVLEKKQDGSLSKSKLNDGWSEPAFLDETGLKAIVQIQHFSSRVILFEDPVLFESIPWEQSLELEVLQNNSKPYKRAYKDIATGKYDLQKALAAAKKEKITFKIPPYLDLEKFAQDLQVNLVSRDATTGGTAVDAPKYYSPFSSSICDFHKRRIAYIQVLARLMMQTGLTGDKRLHNRYKSAKSKLAMANKVADINSLLLTLNDSAMTALAGRIGAMTSYAEKSVKVGNELHSAVKVVIANALIREEIENRFLHLKSVVEITDLYGDEALIEAMEKVRQKIIARFSLIEEGVIGAIKSGNNSLKDLAIDMGTGILLKSTIKWIIGHSTPISAVSLISAASMIEFFPAKEREILLQYRLILMATLDHEVFKSFNSYKTFKSQWKSLSDKDKSLVQMRIYLGKMFNGDYDKFLRKEGIEARIVKLFKELFSGKPAEKKKVMAFSARTSLKYEKALLVIGQKGTTDYLAVTAPYENYYKPSDKLLINAVGVSLTIKNIEVKLDGQLIGTTLLKDGVGYVVEDYHLQGLSGGTHNILLTMGSQQEEMIFKILANYIDTDQDGVHNHLDPDDDNDGLADGLETNNYLTNSLLADTDNDGLYDGEEVYIYKTQPLVEDSDNDTYDDLTEVSFNSDPKDKNSIPTESKFAKTGLPAAFVSHHFAYNSKVSQTRDFCQFLFQKGIKEVYLKVGMIGANGKKIGEDSDNDGYIDNTVFSYGTNIEHFRNSCKKVGISTYAWITGKSTDDPGDPGKLDYSKWQSNIAGTIIALLSYYPLDGVLLEIGPIGTKGVYSQNQEGSFLKLLKNLEHNLTLNNLSNKKIGVVTNKYRLLNGKESVWFWDKVHFEKVAQYVHRLVMPINHYGYNGFSELVGDSHFQKDFKGFSPLKFTSKFHYIRAISKTMRDLSATSGVQEKLFLSVMSEAGQSNSYHTEYETLKNAVDALLYLPGSHKPSGMALFKVLDDSTPGQSQWDQFLKIFPARDCTDQDGDGYGEGVDCLGTDCNDKDKNYDDNCPCLHPTVTKSCTNGWCTIPRGCSTMGSPYEEGGRYAIEHPHQVRLTYDFEIQSTEVTQGQFKALMGYNNSSFSSCGDDCPVEQVAWYEAIAYCNALSKSKGYEECFECTSNGWMLNDCKLKSRFSKPQECKGYRLPTEAEWEYAARAGTVTAFYNGDIYTDYDNCKMEPNLDKIGWYCGNSGDKTHKVGQKQANSWGLYDMSGNVEEWVWDRFSTSLGVDATDPVGPSSGSNRFVRGGSWNSGAVECRLAFRMGLFPSVIERNLGFRPCKTLGN